MKKIALALSVMLGISGVSYAEQWNVLGPRAMAMGGAGVASDNGAVGDYWNPASLGESSSPSGLQIPVGGHVDAAGGILEGSNNLSNTYSSCGSGGSGVGGAFCLALNSGNIQNDLNMMTGSGNGLVGDIGAGADFKFGHVAFFINELGYVGAQGQLNGATGASVLGYIQNNSNTTASPTLTVQGLSATEAGFGYGHEIPWVPGLSLGGNLKVIVGEAGYANNCVFTGSGITNAPCTNSSGGGNLSLKNATKESIAPGVDLGALWDAQKAFAWMPFHPKLGITARDINDPTFAESQSAIAAGASGQMALGGNVRAGVSISPFHWWNFAADVDLTKNTTFVDGLLYQMAGVGTEINIFNRPWLNLALRGGLEQNMAAPSSNLIVTGGFGINLLHIMLDLGAQVTPKMQYISTSQGGNGSTQQIPSDLALSVQLGFMFGGTD